MSRGSALALVLAVAVGASGCAYRSVAERGLCVDRSIRTRPFDDSRVMAADIEGLVYVPGDDKLWIGDDNADQLYVVERYSGAFRGRLRARDFEAFFPEAAECDDGDGDPETRCSYTTELETLLYDPDTATLYVINTVGDVDRDPPVDRAALFVLRREGSHENFRFRWWRELPAGYQYEAAAMIEGRVFVAVDDTLVEYDLETNRMASRPALRTSAGHISGVGWDGTHVWLVTFDRILVQVDWRSREQVAAYELQPFGITRPKGLALAPGEFLIPEGNAPNPILALRFDTAPTGLVRAGWAGGWPRSCP